MSLTGVEPAAFRLGGERSILLSYRDKNRVPVKVWQKSIWVVRLKISKSL